MFDNLLGHAACTNNKRCVPFMIAENAFGKFYAGERDRHWPGGDLRFGANAFADFARALKDTIEDGSGRTVIERLAVGRFYLTENFGFPEHHRIKPGSNAIQMAHGFGTDPAVEFAVQLRARDAVLVREKGFHSFGHDATVAAGNDVE